MPSPAARRMQVAASLPECGLCGVPTRREAFDGNGGICTPCAGVAGQLNPDRAQSNARWFLPGEDD